MTTNQRELIGRELIDGVRPPVMDRLAEQAYAERRADDLARIMAAEHETGRSGRRARPVHRRPSLLITVTALTGAVAAAAVVVAPGPSRDPAPGTTTSPGANSAEMVDGRAVLLASAAKAERDTGRIGRYWYTRARTTEISGITRTPPSGERGTGAGRTARRAERPGDIAWVVYVHTREVWWPRGGERGYERIRDGKATYPSVADRDFIARYGRGENRFEPREGPYAVRTVALGNTELTLDQLGALPKTVPALDARLRREFRKAIGPVPANKKISYSAFVWDCAALLLAEPISPGTKAALFRLLAGQRGLRAVGRAKDPLGRYGVAFAWQAPKEERRLIIDPASGRELAVVDTPREQGTPGHWTAYEAMNWTDTISGRSDRVVESPKK